MKIWIIALLIFISPNLFGEPPVFDTFISKEQTCIPFNDKCKKGDIIFAGGFDAASKCDFNKSVTVMRSPAVARVSSGDSRPNME